MLKREDVDVNTFASSIRLQRKLEQKGLSEEQIESFMENVDVHCFRCGLKPEEFINTVNKIQHELRNSNINQSKSTGAI
jgi:hypothetical protein